MADRREVEILPIQASSVDLLRAPLELAWSCVPKIGHCLTVLDQCRGLAAEVLTLAPTDDRAVPWLTVGHLVSTTIRHAVASICLKTGGFVDQGFILDRSMLESYTKLLVIKRKPLEASLGYLLNVSNREVTAREALIAQFEPGENPYGEGNYRKFLDSLSEGEDWAADLARSHGFDPAKLRKQYGKTKQHSVHSGETAQGFRALGDLLADVAHVRGLQMQPTAGSNDDGAVVWRLDPVVANSLEACIASTLSILLFTLGLAGQALGISEINRERIFEINRRILDINKKAVSHSHAPE
jgi:hypothetical protein